MITSKILNQHFIKYPTHKGLLYSSSFGSILSFLIGTQLITGLFLTMHYIPETSLAFKSVEIITNELSYGYLIRFLHMNTASFIFIFIYLHIMRGLYFKLYLNKNKYGWWSGYLLYILMIVISFLGYVLPWGQMSFWGATVITNLLAILPFGERLVEFIWGSTSVSDQTLRRFFVLHYIIPFIMSGLIILHLFFIHKKNTTDRVNKGNISGKTNLTLYPSYIIKDIFVFFLIFIFLVCISIYYPYLFANPVNEIPANPLVTPEHILPKWYFSPFYAILKFVPNKLIGIIFMFSFIILPAFLPLFNTKNLVTMDVYNFRVDEYRNLIKYYKVFKKNGDEISNYYLKQIIIFYNDSKFIKILPSLKFLTITFTYIFFAITACTTIFSHELCNYVLFLYFFIIILPINDESL